MDISAVGIDLAKNVFHVHGVNAHGKTVLQKKLSREQLKEFMTNLPSCLVGMEACGGSNYWARTFQRYGHDVKLMAAQFVKPYVKSNKNDHLDAEAICEAVQRPNMRFVSVKSIEAQDIQSVHRVRALLVKNRVALSNQIRGLLSEYGIVVAKTNNALIKKIPEILEDAENELSDYARNLFSELYDQLKECMNKVKVYDKKIDQLCRDNEICQRLIKIAGIGPLCATAMVMTVGNAAEFKNGREMAAYIGLVPRQHSTGGKSRLLGISKRGDRYVRALLIHGARAAITRSTSMTNHQRSWVRQVQERRGVNKAVVALANKNARIMWSLIAKNEEYQPK